MPPVILAVTQSKIAAITYDELIKASTETIFESVSPDHNIFVYVYGLDANYSVTADSGSRRALNFTILNSKDRTDILPPLGILGLGVVKELEVQIPSSQVLKRLLGTQRYGPVLFTKIKVVDVKNGASNFWPLCITLNVPVILGVTGEPVKSGSTVKPLDVYDDLLKKNLANLVKGTTPGHIKRGSGLEDPPPDVYIYGCNFDLANLKVKPVDIPGMDRLNVNKRCCRIICTVEFDFSIGPLQKKFQFDLQEIGVSLPTMAELQNSGNYLRNAMLMAFGVQVLNDRRNGEESNAWQWPMWLPMPNLTAVEPDKRKGYGNGQHLANETCNNDQGEVRWYLGSPFVEQKRPLGKYIQGAAEELQKIGRVPFDQLSRVWDFKADALKGKKTIVLPKALVDTLSIIRDAGELCEIDHNQPSSWIDDTVYFRPPFELCYQDGCGYEYDPAEGDPDQGVQPWTPFTCLPTDWVCPRCKNSQSRFTVTGNKRYKDAGFAVVWRGDIPSLPLPINLIEYAKDLARRLWRPVVGNGMPDFNVPIPIPAGEVIQLGVERLEDVSNELLGFINKIDGLTVRFAFLSRALDTGDFRMPNGGPSEIGTEADRSNFFDKALEPGKTGIASKVIKFIYNPLAGDFDLQLQVFIGGKITLWGREVNIPDIDFPIGPKLRFHPEPIKLPTVAIFFQAPDYGGAALVALEAGTGLFGKSDVHIDATTSGSANEARVHFINMLRRITDVLNVVNTFSLHTIPGLDKIIDVAGKICAIGKSVINSTGTIENVTDCVIDLGDILGNHNFNDDISSVVMIGPPHMPGGRVIKCWQHSLRRPDLGRCLKLKMPADKFVFTIADFSQIPIGFFDPKTLAPNEITLNTLNFDGLVTGIEFTTE